MPRQRCNFNPTRTTLALPSTPATIERNWSWQWQCIAFAVFAAASVPLWRRFALKVEPESEAPLLNRRTEALIGRVFTLEKPIVDGVGTVRIDDTIWRVRGPDRPAGSRVKITQADGANLAVEPAPDLAA